MNEVNVATVDRSRDGSGWIRVLGIITIILGIIAILAPILTGAVVSAVIGMVLLITGIVELIFAFATDGWKAGVLAFIGGIITIIAGGLLIARPVIGSAVLTILLGTYFLLDGIARISLSFKARPISGWGWMLFGGVLSIILGILIFIHWPLSGLWAVGVLVGIRILFAGAGMLITGVRGE